MVTVTGWWFHSFFFTPKPSGTDLQVDELTYVSNGLFHPPTSHLLVDGNPGAINRSFDPFYATIVKLGGGFKYFLFFIPTWRNHPI